MTYDLTSDEGDHLYAALGSVAYLSNLSAAAPMAAEFSSAATTVPEPAGAAALAAIAVVGLLPRRRRPRHASGE